MRLALERPPYRKDPVVAAQKLFETHHQLLSDAVSAHGGSELQWLGDRLMVAFASTADAVRCATAMQQAAAQEPGGRGSDPLQPGCLAPSRRLRGLRIP